MKHFWCQIYTFSLFDEVLQLDKFEGPDFKYNIFFQNYCPKIPKQRIFDPKFRHLDFFSPNFAIRQIREC